MSARNAAALDDYRRQGFALVKGVFSHEEILEFRRRCAAVYERTGGKTGDLLSYDEFRDVVLDRRVLELARTVLGDDIAYFGDSTFVANSRFDRHLHNDARGDDADPTRSEYPIIRLGIYLQDHSLHSDGLKVRPGSHKSVFWTARNLVRLVAPVGGDRLSLAAFRPRWFHNVETEPGDIVFWNLRMHHSAHAVRLRRLERFALPTALEPYLPAFLRKPAPKNRYAMFMSWGQPSATLHRYVKDLAYSPLYSEFWARSSFDQKPVAEACARERVTLIKDALTLSKMA